MKVLTTTGLTELITKTKNWCRTTFLNKTDVEQTSTLSIDSTPTASSNNLVTSGGVATALSDKQATLTSAQLNAANSGITSGKVSTYDGYASQISEKYTKPASGIPSSDMSSAVQTSLGKADTALQSHQSLSAYRTSAAQDVIDGGKQAKITASGVLQGDGSGGVTAKAVDAAPTASSANLVTSGGVASGLSGKVGYSDKLSSITGAMSDAEKTTVFSRQAIIKTALDAVLVPLANYFLGEQSSLTLTLPTSGMSAGQTIEVVFYSGSTAATLNVVGDFLGSEPTISTNQRVELNFLYDGVYWMLLSNVVEVSV